MSKLDDAKKLADFYLDEVNATIEIRQTYNSIVVGMNGPLVGLYKDNKYYKGIILDALKYKAVDPSALYRPLVVQLHGIFENYIRSVVKAVVEEKFETVAVYADLEEMFRKDHVTHAARILMHWKEGSIQGLTYPFELLLKNLGLGLSGSKGYKLNPEIFTKFMGNPTSGRLEKLFASLSLPEPFSDKLGQNGALKEYFTERAKGRVSERARETLDEKIDLRNDIVHGDLTRAVDLTELQDTLSYFRSLIAALDQLVRT